MSIAPTKLVTAEELLAMGDIGRCELINGEIIHYEFLPAENGAVIAELACLIDRFVERNDLGCLFAAGTGFIIARGPDTVRAADVSFVRNARVKRTRGFFDGAPDLAVEVMSPDDRVSEVIAKVDQWLAAGATSVWIVDPPNQTIEIYRRESQPLRYRAGDVVRDEPTLPGFELPLADVFA